MKIPDSYYRLQGEIMAAGYSSKTPILRQEDINRCQCGCGHGCVSVAHYKYLSIKCELTHTIVDCTIRICIC